jgi:hypothetical protein
MKPERERRMKESGANILQKETSFEQQLVCHISTWKSVNKVMNLRAQYA